MTRGRGVASATLPGKDNEPSTSWSELLQSLREDKRLDIMTQQAVV